MRLLRLVAQEVSTAHSPSAYPFAVPAPAGFGGVVIGLDRVSGSVWSYDPFDAYGAGVISSPSMLVLGAIGRGKSALVKTYLAREAEVRGRAVFVLDPKGEYRALAERLGLSFIALRPGGTERLNPLEMAPGTDPMRRAEVLEALAQIAAERPLRPVERAGLAALCSVLDDHATLTEAVELLGRPEAFSERLRLSTQGAREALADLGYSLGRLTTGALAGILDRSSTARLDPDGPGLVLDLSASFGTAALAPVMAAATAWLDAAIRRANRARLVVVDEAWALLSAPAAVSWLQATAKLARTNGASLVLVTHRVSDLRAAADAGSATAEAALGLLADTDTQVIYAQPEAERALAAQVLGLTEVEVDLVCHLPRYRALWRTGSVMGLVDHALAPGDEDFVDSDQAMRQP
jgi:type IV secretory pathway VirB4 component